MPCVGLEITIRACERAKTVHALDRSATVTGSINLYPLDFTSNLVFTGRLCGLLFRVPGYKSRNPGFDSRLYQIFWDVVSLERGPLSLVRIIEELLERKVAAPV
jgi:hypothetical protein